MKKIALLIVASSVLSGCTVLDAYLMTGYDSSEYAAITSIRTKASIAKDECDDFEKSKSNAIILADEVQYFEFYEQKIPRNENGYNAAKSLNKIAQGLKDRYQQENSVSKIYCETKFKSIEVSSELIQKTLGDRPR